MYQVLSFLVKLKHKSLGNVVKPEGDNDADKLVDRIEYYPLLSSSLISFYDLIAIDGLHALVAIFIDDLHASVEAATEVQLSRSLLLLAS